MLLTAPRHGRPRSPANRIPRATKSPCPRMLYTSIATADVWKCGALCLHRRLRSKVPTVGALRRSTLTERPCGPPTTPSAMWLGSSLRHLLCTSIMAWSNQRPSAIRRLTCGVRSIAETFSSPNSMPRLEPASGSCKPVARAGTTASAILRSMQLATCTPSGRRNRTLRTSIRWWSTPITTRMVSTWSLRNSKLQRKYSPRASLMRRPFWMVIASSITSATRKATQLAASGRKPACLAPRRSRKHRLP
mmetsp:Transcript_22825/g.71509  ORF Transcript_22825/g.71509 Transcript_22825/m.71509 type:complete len:248 (+) Transcript_22825:7261-8004(+)